MNNICITGRLTRKATLDTSTKGKKYCKFIVAVQKAKDQADFFSCVAWGELAENIVNYTDKGSHVGVIGSMNSRSFETADGKKQTFWELFATRCEFISNVKTSEPKEENAPQELKQELVDDDNLPF